ncbi:MAG: hypothetical protein MSA15_20510 [Clostridium sp.]|nr:hypothetical protein [Clostridium sp.]
MEKYNMILNELKGMKEFKKGIDVDYESLIDSILITFYNMRAFKKLNNSNSKVWKNFKDICNKYNVNYKFQSYGAIEIYF